LILYTQNDLIRRSRYLFGFEQTPIVIIIRIYVSNRPAHETTGTYGNEAIREGIHFFSAIALLINHVKYTTPCTYEYGKTVFGIYERVCECVFIGNGHKSHTRVRYPREPRAVVFIEREKEIYARTSKTLSDDNLNALRFLWPCEVVNQNTGVLPGELHRIIRRWNETPICLIHLR